MLGVGFLAGFAAGWASRSTTDVSRSATVKVMAALLSLADSVKRMIATERENLEDLMAEARAEVELSRAYRRGATRKAPAPAESTVGDFQGASARDRAA